MIITIPVEALSVPVWVLWFVAVLIGVVLTPTETAERLKVKPITIIRLFDAGILPGVILRQGVRKRVIRFREETIEKFITSREKQTNRVEVGDGATTRR